MSDQAPAPVTDLDEQVDRLRGFLDEPYVPPRHNTGASADAIRHFAHGVGDDNPLYCDLDYGASTRWGATIAPPTFVMTCGFPRSFGLPGVHGLFAGAEVIAHAPIRAGTQVDATSRLIGLDEKQGRYAGRSFVQRIGTEYRDPDGDLLSEMTSYAFRTQRDEGQSSTKYAAAERPSWSSEEIAEFAAAYKAEEAVRRGAKMRTFAETEVGEELPALLKGPLTVTDNIAWILGFGPVYVMAHRRWYAYQDRHPRAATPDPYGVPDVPERVHWDEDFAQAIGMPAPFDYGPQRVAWLSHLVTDWAGDDAWIRRVSVKLTAPNYVGDLTRCSGSVLAKSGPEERVVQLEMTATDQRGRVTASGEADVVLAS